MTQTLKRVLWIAVGWAFIVAGVVGFFLPFFQGILCVIIGLIILSSEYVWAHKLLMKLRRRFPKLTQAADKCRDKAVQWFQRDTSTEGAQ